jgi:condensin complex subunit 3
LTPESTILARVFVEHCVQTKNERLLDSASLPVVTAFAFHIQEAYNSLLNKIHEHETNVAESHDDEDEESEEEVMKGEIVLGELLKMAMRLDYGDETGRRQVFSVMSKSISFLAWLMLV